MTRAFVLCVAFLALCSSLAAATPPNPPAITEPPHDGTVVNAEDLHMETGPFSDPDPGDTHFCTDWEVWTLSPSERVWTALCVTGVERVHIHLGDGAFIGSHAGRLSLLTDTMYELRVRHSDQTGSFSAFSTRGFVTGPPSQVFPLLLDDIASTPVPEWRDESGAPIELPSSDTPGTFLVQQANGNLLLSLEGQESSGNSVNNPPAIGYHGAVRVVISGGSSNLALPQSRLSYTGGNGQDGTVYLPQMLLGADESGTFWIAASGASYFGTPSQTEPDFSLLAQGAPVPWRVSQAGYKVEVVATGFQLPVNIAFVPNPGNDPSSPRYYVSELYGQIKLVTRDGTISDYVTGLLNFDPSGNFPGSGEQGLTGLVVDPISGDLFASTLYDAAPPNGPHYPKVIRLHSVDGGHTAASITPVLDMVGEPQGQSHQISNLSIGPDGKLYVHMGDGFEASTALNLDSFRGKVLRLNLDGTAPTDNPFYNAGDGIHARDYVYAYGFRNPFGGAWRLSDGAHYEVENGPNSNDRFARVDRGMSYGWDGTDQSMTTRAIYNWAQPHAPVNIAIVQSGVFAGSGFPADKLDHAFVTESGPTWGTGPQPQGKRVVEFVVDASGALVSGPSTLVEYEGTGKATAVGIAAGPDGLYFSDLYKDVDFQSPIDRGANILRISYVGTADFSLNPTFGAAPLFVTFTDLSNVPGVTGYRWDFGDGTTSTEENPSHLFTTEGAFNVRLEVTGANGVAVAQKNGCVVVGSNGLTARYFDNVDYSGAKITRLDSTLDFDWGVGAPDPSMGPDLFSVRWTGQVRADFNETYTFYTLSDDGVRLWIDHQLIIDQWVDQGPTEHSASLTLEAGKSYDLRMDFYENGGGAVAQLRWSSASTQKVVIPTDHLLPQPDLSHGLRGEYHNGAALSDLRLERFDSTLDFGWGVGSPDPTLPVDLFSVRWTGQLLADHTETYTLFTTTDDGVRLWIDNQLVIDKWIAQPPTTWSVDLPFVAGHRYDLRMEYFENAGGAVARLEWQSPRTFRRVIPRDHLFPPGTTDADSQPGPIRQDAIRLLSREPLSSEPALLSLELARGGDVDLSLYDAAGRRVESLLHGEQGWGAHRFTVEPARYSSGVYFLRAKTAGGITARKLLIVR